MLESTKENRIFPPVSHPLAPPNSYSIPWMPPHWSPLRPWLPAGVPLTFSLWPPEPQRHRLNLLSRRCILGTTVMTTEGSDSEYRCYRYSSKLLLSLYLQHVLPKRSTEMVRTSPSPLSFFFFVFHLWWCSWVKEKILLFPGGALSATERIQLQESSAFIIIEEMCLLSSLTLANPTIYSAFSLFPSVNQDHKHTRPLDKATVISSSWASIWWETISSACGNTKELEECLCLLGFDAWL